MLRRNNHAFLRRVISNSSTTTATRRAIGSATPSAVAAASFCAGPKLATAMRFNSDNDQQQQRIKEQAKAQVDNLFRGSTPITEEELEALQLHQAADAGDVTRVKELLADGQTKVNETDADGECALHIACIRAGDGEDVVEVGRLLIHAGAAVNAKTARDETPLFFACLANSAPMVRLLLEAGAKSDINRCNEEGDGVLTAALYPDTPSEELIELLLANGADPLGKDVLHLATKSNNPKIVKMILDKDGGKAIDRVMARTGGQAIHTAAATGACEEVLSLLVAAGADVNARLINKAPGEEDEDPRVQAQQAIFVGSSALGVALLEDKYKTAELLCKKFNADVNVLSEGGWSPMLCAALRGDAELINLLLAHGAKLDAVASDGANVYHLLSAGRCRDQAAELIKMIREKAPGLDVNARARDEAITPIAIAATYDNAEMVKALLSIPECDADAPMKGSGGSTPLILAIGHRNMATIAELLKASATKRVDLNKPRASDGMTPIALAVALGLKETVHMLKSAGASMEFKNDEFSSLRDVSERQENDPELTAMLP